MEKYKRVSEMTLEEKRRKVAKFNVMDDVFFQKMMEDKEVCEEILRIILEDSGLQVIECIPQASIKNVAGKSVVLDVLCRDKDGKYYNIEVQKADDDDHQKRVRYNGALASMHTMQAGKDYKELPDVKIVFISKFDVFHGNHAMYHVDRVVRETGQVVENGQTEIYVNAKAKDGTPVAELMEYFVDSNGKKDICPKLSDRVILFKTEQKEVTAMCELMEQERLAGREEGRQEGREEGRQEGQELAVLKMLEKYMLKHDVDFDEAFDSLKDLMDLPEDQYLEYREKIEERGNVPMLGYLGKSR